jgi:hypothetical protein
MQVHGFRSAEWSQPQPRSRDSPPRREVASSSSAEIKIAGERVSVPVRATYNIERERGDGEDEIEFQIKWSSER